MAESRLNFQVIAEGRLNGGSDQEKALNVGQIRRRLSSRPRLNVSRVESTRQELETNNLPRRGKELHPR